LGVIQGWHCLEVGAGGGSVAVWLCERVGSSGHVLATDLDTRFLEGLDYSNLEVRRHDIVSDALPEGAFDLVHARMVLMHLTARERALHNMVGALKPGGWLLVEQIDSVTFLPDPGVEGASLFSRGTNALNKVQTGAGVDENFGRRLYGEMHAAGLADVDGEGRVPLIHDGSACARMCEVTMAQRRDRMVGAGLLSDEEADRFLALFTDASFVAMGSMVMAVWGRKAG
jgi:SAM-dependent methyltransferase